MTKMKKKKKKVENKEGGDPPPPRESVGQLLIYKAHRGRGWIAPPTNRGRKFGNPIAPSTYWRRVCMGHETRVT